MRGAVKCGLSCPQFMLQSEDKWQTCCLVPSGALVSGSFKSCSNVSATGTLSAILPSQMGIPPQ